MSDTVPELVDSADEGAAVVAALATLVVVASVLVGAVVVGAAAEVLAAVLVGGADAVLEAAAELVAAAALRVVALVNGAWLASVELTTPVKLVTEVVLPPQAASKEFVAPAAVKTPSRRSI
ncbi:MAG: hypothetical protein ACR2JY_00925 [Chloroflexota bacterium]